MFGLAARPGAVFLQRGFALAGRACKPKACPTAGAGGPQIHGLRGFAASPGALCDVVVFLTGPDRVGLVHTLCKECINPVQGQIGKTRFTRLGKSGFTNTASSGAMYQVTLPEKNVATLTEKLDKTFPDHLVGVRRTDSDGAPSGAGLVGEGVGGSRTVEILGPDAKGLLERVTECLLKTECNVLAVNSDVIPGSHVGYDMFKSMVVVGIPRIADDERVTTDLDDLADDLGVEITVTKGNKLLTKRQDAPPH